ncbi:MAG: OB-fold nucleic acid binding domain-containing protein [Thermodesulfobacteriota bacterium]|nr:OB-fold nucleic acid binding domain-containing protein [Thermodesulfobacteriota bacterium]
MDRKALDLFLTESGVMQVSASAHIMAPFREDLKRGGFIQSTALRWKSHGSLVKAAGRVIIIHTPPTRSGKRVLFLTLEDEEGLFDLTVFEDVLARCAKKILSSTVLLVEGVMNRFGLRGVSVVARRFWTLKQFYEPTSDHKDSATSPAPLRLRSGSFAPQKTPAQPTIFSIPKKQREDCSLKGEKERTRHEKDKGGNGLVDRQDPDQKRHLLPKASHYRGRPA